LGRTLRDFIERKRREHDRALARHAFLGTSPKFRVRLRVRLGSKIASDEAKLKTTFCGRRVTIQSHKKEKPLSDSNWIVLSASRFKTIEEAAEFGLKLQSALAVAAALRGIPIDVGPLNTATTMTGDTVKDAVAEKGGFLLDDVHGVDVFADTPRSFVLAFEATATTSFPPEKITELVGQVGPRITKLDERGIQAALLMNDASMAQHPVAMLTLSVAAVEMLAAGEKWNASQRKWIKSLRKHLATDAELSEAEKMELGKAIEGLFNFGALAKTRRLLTHLDLEPLIPRWDDLYRDRSNLFHGNQYVTPAELQRLGGEARLVCKEIVDAYLSRALGT
jgi:hypothetical protein